MGREPLSYFKVSVFTTVAECVIYVYTTIVCGEIEAGGEPLCYLHMTIFTTYEEWINGTDIIGREIEVGDEPLYYAQVPIFTAPKKTFVYYI